MRSSDEESIFNGGEEHLSSGRATVRVVKGWLGQFESQAVHIMTKADSEAPAADKQ